MNDDLDIIDRVVCSALTDLAQRRPIFHSEADFQLALAWQIQTAHPEARIRLEQRILDAPRINLDILATVDDVRIGIELKYLRAKADITVDGERFVLIVGAPDLDRYDTVKDIARLERLVGDDLIDVGAAVVLSNNPTFWKPGTGRITGFDEFRMHDGATLTGTLDWGASAGVGTRKGRDQPHTLAGSYLMRWRPYSHVHGVAGDFRALIVPLG